MQEQRPRKIMKPSAGEGSSRHRHSDGRREVKKWV